MSSGRDGGRAELYLFIYLFISCTASRPAGGATQRVCLFRLNKHVPKSPPWDAEESTHRGEENFLQQMDIFGSLHEQ